VKKMEEMGKKKPERESYQGALGVGNISEPGQVG